MSNALPPLTLIEEARRLGLSSLNRLSIHLGVAPGTVLKWSRQPREEWPVMLREYLKAQEALRVPAPSASSTLLGLFRDLRDRTDRAGWSREAFIQEMRAFQTLDLGLALAQQDGANPGLEGAPAVSGAAAGAVGAPKDLPPGPGIEDDDYLTVRMKSAQGEDPRLKPAWAEMNRTQRMKCMAVFNPDWRG